MDYFELHKTYKCNSLFGRYITLNAIEPIINKIIDKDCIKAVGSSVLEKPIYKLVLGSGKIKILMWSQMHGNESTTTKALLDFLNFLQNDKELGFLFLKKFTFCILPMINPDGAELYTRENYNKVDLNRDSMALTQPESRVLQDVFYEFKPDFCYNLHDQRSIFGVGSPAKSATVSFLAPSFNEAREINDVRIKAMNVIVEMNHELQKYIPNQVGRFDDSFNINCIGDKLTSLNVPTILFEAGHFQDDYYREYSRKMIFIALIAGLMNGYENDIVSNKTDFYLQIPQNNIVFYDFIYKNVKINYDSTEIITNFAAQYKEEFIDGQFQLNAYIVEVGDLKGRQGHFQFNAHKMKYTDGENDFPNLNQNANFVLGNDNFFVNGLKK